MSAYTGPAHLERQRPIEYMHTLTRVEQKTFLYFTCSSKPKVEMQSPGIPRRCPLCQKHGPIEMGTVEFVEGYSEYFGDEKLLSVAEAGKVLDKAKKWE